MTLGAFLSPGAPDYAGDPEAPRKPRTRDTYANALVVLLGLAIALWVFHGTFHVLADWLGYGYDNALGAILGPNPIGEKAHVLLEIVTGAALISAFIFVWRSRWRRS